jgi:hypothetical protein
VGLIKGTNDVGRSSAGVEVQFLLPVVSAPFRLIFAFNPQVWSGQVNVGTSTVTAHEPRHDVKFTIGRSF